MTTKQIACIALALLSFSLSAQRLRVQATVTGGIWKSLTTTDLSSVNPGANFTTPIYLERNDPASITRFRYMVDNLGGGYRPFHVTVSRTVASWPTTIPLAVARSDVGTYTTITAVAQTFDSGTANMPAWVNLIIRVGLDAQYLIATPRTTTLTYTLIQP